MKERKKTKQTRDALRTQITIKMYWKNLRRVRYINTIFVISVARWMYIFILFYKN